MLNKLFKKYTIHDLLETLKENNFKEAKADAMLKDVNINYRDNNNQTLLHIVAIDNLTEAIKWLNSKKIDLNAQDGYGDTALMAAVKANATHSIKALLLLSADANIKNDEGRLPIQEALANGYHNAFKLLKKRTKDFKHKDNEGKSLINDAIDSLDLDLVENISSIIDNEIDPEILFYPNTYSDVNILRFIASIVDLNISDSNGRTPLFYLIKNNALNTDSFMYLLSNGADINHVDNDGNNILMALIKEILKLQKGADEEEHIKSLLNMIPWILEENIDYNQTDKDGQTALMYATEQSNLDIIEKLLEFEVDPNYIGTNSETPLSYAAMKGKSNIDTVSLLLGYGARPNIENANGKTIIERLIEAELFLKNNKKIKMRERQEINPAGEYKSVLEEILYNGEVNLHMLNSQGNPFFFDCVEYKNLELLKMLVKYGADINLKNKEGYNIIYYYMSKNTSFRKVADHQNYLIMLRNIITLGADVNSRDDYGGTTLHKAILDNDIQTVKILINGGADLNAVDNKGRNMVHNCMWQNKVKIFRLIYSYNKDLINKTDKFGVLPINYAAFLGYGEIVLELIDSGAFVNSPTKKLPYILKFLKKFHKNIKPLLENTRNPSDHKKLEVLIENMIKEFKIEF